MGVKPAEHNRHEIENHPLPRAVLIGGLFFCSSIALGAKMQLQVNFDFPGGLARVSSIDQN
jgi:hypothetical protein